MNLANEQIVALYEDSNLSIEQIFEACEGSIAIEAIRIALVNGSKKYRSLAKKDDTLFPREDALLARTIIRQLATDPDTPPAVTLKCAKVMLDEHFGRNDLKAARSLNINVNVINQHIAEAEAAIKKAKSITIDINPAHKHLAELAA